MIRLKIWMSATAIIAQWKRVATWASRSGAMLTRREHGTPSVILSSFLLILAFSLLAMAPPRAARAEDRGKPIRALLVVGGCCHDYAKQKDILTQGISARRQRGVDGRL